mmetsp:Transcript_2997/g.3061  ORF Transcript_2997/g.3061 Transcript_2997/m.3061 type:complete len:720 (+) Transcript_2997:2-2161(+)
MTGDMNSLQLEGIIPRMVKHVFNYISNSTSEIEYIVKLSMMEIYMERIRDLVETSRTNLNVREDKNKGIFVEDLSEHYVASEEEVLDLIQMGSDNRTTGFTNMNDYSSRSHTILVLTIKSSNVEDMSTKTGKLFLVDLAGSEKISKTGATGLTLEEAKIINSSLMTLGMVINSLTDEKSTHIPYRESKITRILQESLGGNAKTCLIITCSPSGFNDNETLSTLRFGMRAKKIENKPKINKEISAAELKIEVDRLEGIIGESEARIRQLEKYIVSNGLQIPSTDMSGGRNKTPMHTGSIIKLNSTYDNDKKIELDCSSTPDLGKGYERKNSLSQQKHHPSKSGVVHNNNSRYSELLDSQYKQQNTFSDNTKILNLISENKSLSKKLKEAEDALQRYHIEASERQKVIKDFFEKRYKTEEAEKENVNKIEFLERKIKKLKYEQAEGNSTEIYNSSTEPLQKKIEELVLLVSQNYPSFEFHQKEFARETESLINKLKTKQKLKNEEDIEEYYISKNSVPDIREIEEKFNEKVKALNREVEDLKNREREKSQQLTASEKQILTLKEKIDYFEKNNSLSIDEKNYIKKIESLESALEKVNSLYYKLNIQKSVLTLENEVQSKFIWQKNDLISKLESGIEQQIKDDDIEKIQSYYSKGHKKSINHNVVKVVKGGGKYKSNNLNSLNSMEITEKSVADINSNELSMNHSNSTCSKAPELKFLGRDN